MRFLALLLVAAGCSARPLDLPERDTVFDLGLGAPPDLATADLATPSDLPPARDLAPVPDLASTILAPRPIAPLSTATVTSQTPRFRWALANGDDAAMVELCRDRACSTTVMSFTVAGTSATAPAALTRGLYYWRVRGVAGGIVGSATSPAWEFVVGARSAAVSTSWGTFPDVNGDGFADVVIASHSSQTGAVRLYLGSAAGVSTSPIAVPLPSSSYGTTVASAGDVNGDGYGDLVVGGVETARGVAAVYLGGASGLAATPTLLDIPAGNSSSGCSVAGAGDVNGDGYADVIIGGCNNYADPGHAYLYLGSATGITKSGTLVGTNPCGLVAGAGDVNGDDFADVVLSWSSFGGFTGTAWISYGSGNGLSSPTPLYSPDTPDSSFAYSVSSAGDVNGDGYADFLIGAIGDAHLYLGSAAGAPAMPSTTIAKDLSTWFGSAVSGAGDIDGDGYGDIVVGSLAADSYAGLAYVFLSPGGQLATTTSITLTYTNEAYTEFGSTVGGAGDINRDGLSEIIVAAPAHDNGVGSALVYSGQGGGVSAPTVLIGPDGPNHYFGISVQ